MKVKLSLSLPRQGFSLCCFIFLFSLTGLLGAQSAKNHNEPVSQPEVQFVFTADPHYGITRKSFQGMQNVDVHIVNAKLVEKLNTISYCLG